jgi:PKHD-type hydroxylase
MSEFYADENYSVEKILNKLNIKSDVESKLVNNYIKNFNILPENNELTNYYFYRGSYLNNIDLVNKIVNNERNNLKEGIVTNHVDISYRNSKILWIKKNEESYPLYKDLVYYVKDANKDMWNFKINTFCEDLQYAEYDSENQGQYDWHLDIGEKSSSTRKLSISIQLSDPEEYEGGELQFQTGRSVRVAPKEKGTVIIFPSYFLHRVTPVTKGVRKSLVYWVHGEPFC